MTKYEKIINEVHQAVLGIEGTDERGLAGDIKDIKEYLKIQNGKLLNVDSKTNKNRNWLIGISGLLVGCGILEWQDIIHIFGG